MDSEYGKPAHSSPDDLQARSDDELLALMRAQPRGSKQRDVACDLLVSRNQHLVLACVRRYANSPEPLEDLMQTGYIGLLNAINNYDPAYGKRLAAYALPCISGELKRHFRDKRWQVRVERPLQELVLEARRAIPRLTQRLGHEPGDAELAEHLGRSPAEIRQARKANQILTAMGSVDALLPGATEGHTLGDLLGQEDPGIQHAVDMQAVAAHWEELPGREQRILLLRFYADMTQRQIGQRMGISQMHVSRLLDHALGYLRERVTSPETAGGRYQG